MVGIIVINLKILKIINKIKLKLVTKLNRKYYVIY